MSKWRIERILVSLRRRKKRAALAWQGRGENGIGQALLVAVLNLLKVRRVVRFRVSGVPLHIRTTTTALQSASHCLDVEYERVFDQITPSEGLMIDAGAHIGAAAIAFSRRFPHARVLCLEPCPDNYRLCSINTRAFANITVWQAALSQRRGTQPLYGRSTGFEGNTLVAEASDRVSSAPLAMVDVVDVPTILDAFGTRSVEFLKLDIEGAEKQLFDDASSWIPSVEVMSVELHERIAEGCTAAFRKANVGRRVVPLAGEKHLSIRQAAPLV